uniref:Uncharacterized protein n=1 Tax=Anguilla anguilla TaxID=7936 RepID=A0A0E9UPW3_ANGAN
MITHSCSAVGGGGGQVCLFGYDCARQRNRLYERDRNDKPTPDSRRFYSVQTHSHNRVLSC